MKNRITFMKALGWKISAVKPDGVYMIPNPDVEIADVEIGAVLLANSNEIEFFDVDGNTIYKVCVS